MVRPRRPLSKKDVNGLLQHTLLIADNDIRSIKFEQPFEAVVSVDNAAVQIIEVRSRKPATFQWHQRTQVRREYRDDLQDHPLGTIAGIAEGLDDIEPLAVLGPLGDRSGLLHLFAQGFGKLFQVKAHEHFTNGLGSDPDPELAWMFLKRGTVLIFIQERSHRYGLNLRSDNSVGLKIQNPLKLLQGHVEDGADFGRQTLQKPDMGDRCGQFDVAKTLAAHLGLDDLDAAFFAYHTSVLHALVLAAITLVVLDRSEYLGAEQTITLGFERAVVDGFRLFDLTMRPLTNFLRGSERDLYLVKTDGTFRFCKETKQFFHVFTYALFKINPIIRQKPEFSCVSLSPTAIPAVRYRGTILSVLLQVHGTTRASPFPGSCCP